MAEIFIHEDFIKQIELIPEENQFSSGIMLNSIKKGDNLVSPNGWYEEITERSDIKITIESRQIPISDLHPFLMKYCFSYSKEVKYGYSSTELILSNTCCYLFERLALFVEFSKTDFVTSIYMYANSSASRIMEDANFPFVLNSLGLKYNLILIDWDEEILVRIKSKNNSNQYLIDTFDFLPI